LLLSLSLQNGTDLEDTSETGTENSFNYNTESGQLDDGDNLVDGYSEINDDDSDEEEEENQNSISGDTERHEIEESHHKNFKPSMFVRQSRFLSGKSLIPIAIEDDRQDTSDNVKPVFSAENTGMNSVRALIPKMTILLLVVGTRGDVQPFTELGLRLKADGHRVRLATHSTFRSYVIEKGLEFYPLAGDPKLLSEFMVKSQGFLIPTSTELMMEVILLCVSLLFIYCLNDRFTSSGTKVSHNDNRNTLFLLESVCGARSRGSREQVRKK
jgi:hypothetical protein